MVKEIIGYIWRNKKWWMLPPIIILILFGVLIFVSTVSPIGSFIYVLF